MVDMQTLTFTVIVPYKAHTQKLISQLNQESFEYQNICLDPKSLSILGG